MVKSLKLSRILKSGILAGAVLLSSASCSTVLDLLQTAFKNPEISIKSFNFSDANFQKVGFKLLLDIKNPNSVGIKTSNINYNLNLNKSDIISGILNNGVDIGSQKTSSIEIPIDVNFQQLLQAAPSIINNPSKIDYNVSGAVNFNTPIGVVPINWQKADKLDLQQITNLLQIFH